MKPDLDALLQTLKNRPLDSRLDQLEPRVWTRIASRRRPMHASVWGWRTALAAAMMAAGVLAGERVTAAAAQSSAFAIHSEFAPSTLLGEPA